MPDEVRPDEVMPDEARRGDPRREDPRHDDPRHDGPAPEGLGPDAAGLFRVVYRSRHAVPGTAGDGRRAIEAILAASRRRNAEAGITGALMFTGLYFVQALEGPAAAVEAAFDRICCDLRHAAIEVVECGPALERAFGAGAMSYLVPDAAAGAGLDRDVEEGDHADAAAAAMRLLASLVRSPPAGGTARAAGG